MRQALRRGAPAPNNRMMRTRVHSRRSFCRLPLVSFWSRRNQGMDSALIRLYAGEPLRPLWRPAKFRDSCSCSCPSPAYSWRGTLLKRERMNDVLKCAAADANWSNESRRLAQLRPAGRESLIGETILSRLPTVLHASLRSLTSDKTRGFVTTFDRLASILKMFAGKSCPFFLTSVAAIKT